MRARPWWPPCRSTSTPSTGRGAHLVTVNDYLAKRDTEWMGPVYQFMGLTVAALQNNMETADRRAAYHSDITYGTNTEFGFDYLRDNMALSPDQQVQRGYHYCIVDEVDSILIDEAGRRSSSPAPASTPPRRTTISPVSPARSSYRARRREDGGRGLRLRGG